MSRYKVKGDWATDTVLSDHVKIEVSTLIDTRNGQEYRDGAHRVVVKNVEGYRTKTFKGESAWCNAERYANDAEWARRRAA